MEFVHEGTRLPGFWSKLQRQIYLGSEGFVTNMQRLIDEMPTLTQVPLSQRRAKGRELSAFSKSYEKTEATARAYLSAQHTMAAIAKHFNLHYASVSRWVKTYEAMLGCKAWRLDHPLGICQKTMTSSSAAVHANPVSNFSAVSAQK